MIGQAWEIDPLEHLQQVFVEVILIRKGIQELIAQASKDHVGPLRKEEHVLEAGAHDRASSGAGQSGNGAEEGTFSAAAGTHDDESFSRSDFGGEAADDPAFFVERLQ